jgi:hemerythrin superfamily protein
MALELSKVLPQYLKRSRLLVKALLRQEFDVLDRLQFDHMKVEMLFVQYKGARAKKQKMQIFDRIKKELTLHAEAEEAAFYPACEKEESLKELTLESYEEHKQMKDRIREIEGLASKSERFEAKVKVLMDDVFHHVSEEENSLFPKVRRAFSQNQLDRLALEVEDAKRQKKAA